MKDGDIYQYELEIKVLSGLSFQVGIAEEMSCLNDYEIGRGYFLDTGFGFFHPKDEGYMCRNVIGEKYIEGLLDRD